MMRKSLVAFLIWISLLIPVSPGLADVEEELWENKAFANKAQAIKDGNWDNVQTRDLAIVTLFELGRKADALETYLTSRSERFTSSAATLLLIGGAALGAYLVLQLMMTLFMVIRLGRLEKAIQLQRLQQGTRKDF